jgi:uncharacterized protein
MEYEWDENKNKINILNHGLDFYDSPLIFETPVIIVEDTRKEYGETCFIGLGILKTGLW